MSLGRVIVFVIGLVGVSTMWLAVRPPQASPAEAWAAVEPLPARLTDQKFWSLVVNSSEPNGYFRSENLVSNEHTFQYVIPTLERRIRSASVYLGVAPDQNFTYMAAIQPKMAFIIDIRRGNLLEHLMYKAIIELSADRAEFLSRLFSKKRPAGLGRASTVEELFGAFDKVDTNQELYRQNVSAIEDHLLKRHGFKLTADDVQQLEGIYFQFFWEGPSLRYTMSGGGGGSFGRGPRSFGSFSPRGGFGPNFPTYEELMLQADWNGRSRSYLASEEAFVFLKAFEEKNLLVPIVGNFAGSKALRAVGQYVRAHGETVSAFYVSNVEQYLFQDRIWNDFYENVGTFPLDESSVFIRSVSTRMGYSGSMQWSDGRATVLDPIQASVRDFRAGKIRSYYDLNARSK
jgi:hypothetical protein